MSPGSAASITSGVSSRSAARTNSAPPQSSRPSLMSGAGSPGLFHEQHRDVVAYRVGQAARLAGAHQLAGLVIGAQRRVAFRAGQDLQEPAFDLHQVSLLAWAACGGSAALAACGGGAVLAGPDQGEHLVTQGG